MDQSPLAIGMEWVGRITAIAFLMVLPGLLGLWIDRQLGTIFLALIGFGIGLTAGIAYLVVLGRRGTTGSQDATRRQSEGDQ